MNKTLKTLPVAMSFMFGLTSGTANAAWVDLGQIDPGYAFSDIFNLDTSDYVSEQNIASETLTFSLDAPQTIYFFADSFNFAKGTTVFHQIDLLDQGLSAGSIHDVNYLAGVGSIDGLGADAPNFSYNLGPGDYQVNYKVYGHELAWSPDRVAGVAGQGLGDYRLGLSIAGVESPVALLPDVAAVPEPETYALLLAGLALIGLTARRRDGGGRLI